MSEALDSPTSELIDQPGGPRGVVLRGAWDVPSLGPLLPRLLAQISADMLPRDLMWDLRGVLRLDSVVAIFLWRLWGHTMPAALALRPEHEAFFARLQRTPPAPRPKRKYAVGDGIALLGVRACDFFQHLLGTIALGGQLLLDSVRLVARPRRFPFKELSAHVYHAGATALPITALVGFLIGIVMSYLSAQQLRAFGAHIFIVNLVGISVLRELGPLLAALLAAGRSGSAMTAQIGVMRLTQELDALAVMGISASERLVLPRVLALGVALPLLTLWTNAMALWGGMLAARIELGVTYQTFLSRFPDAVPLSNLTLGLGKGAVFGVLIAITSCYFGLRVEPNTRSLGAGTTRAVVTAITLVILADAIFAILTSRVDLL
ncbi:MAG: ABC transporter permease [Vicinamibacteria bacterium]|nr:ABC transporter permease [Vicinamibacteria bacterium]